MAHAAVAHTTAGPRVADAPPTAGDVGSLAAAFLAASEDAFVAVDDAFTVLAWNAAAEELFGWSATEVLGSPVPLFSEEEQAGILAAPETAFPERLPAALVRRRRDGTAVTVVVRQQLALDYEGRKVYGWFLREAGPGEAVLEQRNLLSQALVEAVRVDEVRELVSRAVTDLLGADRAVVLTPCPYGEHLHGHVAFGAHQEDAEQLTVDLAEPGRAQRAATSRTLETGALTFARDRPEATLFVPMGPTHTRWVLALVYPDGVPANATLPQLARALAGEAWAALRRVELVGELEAKIEILEATAAVSGSAGLDLDRVLEAVCRHAAVALSCERAAVYLRPAGPPEEGSDGELELAHVYASDLEAVPEDDDEFVGRRAAAEFLRRQEPVVVQEAAGCPFLDGLWHPERGAVSVFGLPLRVGNRDLGVLIVAHTVAHPRGFTNLCQQVGGSIAQQAALAIENARLFGNERETVRRLSELDRMKADYVAGISHDLRTPLTGLLGFVKTLRRTNEAASPEERREYLETMERQANRLAGMVEALLMGARLEAGELGPDDTTVFGLDELVGESLTMLDPDRRARVQVTAAPGVRVRGDRSQLLRVIGNLVDNALAYSPGSGSVRVVVEHGGHEAVVSVSDDGPGIPEEELPQLFQRYRPGGARQGGSLGLGLYITEGIVSSHGGRITVDTDRGRGTTFTVALPRA